MKTNNWLLFSPLGSALLSASCDTAYSMTTLLLRSHAPYPVSSHNYVVDPEVHLPPHPAEVPTQPSPMLY